MERVYTKDLPAYAGKEVILAGWVHKIKSMGKFSFIVLRDAHGMIQAVVEDEKLIEKLSGCLSETVLELKGEVVKEERAMRGVEIKVKGIEVFVPVKEELPIQIKKKKLNANLDTLLDHRTVSLRAPQVIAVFKIQSKFGQYYREFLTSHGFTEVHTPKIVCAGAEGGTNIFKVEYFDKTAYLDQSPQFYKQIMVSIFERVFEIGSVFRAEEHNTARHLNEYVSLDYEMGFIKSYKDIMDMENKLLKYMMDRIKDECADELKLLNAEVPVVPDVIPKLKLTEVQDILEKEFKKKCKGEPDLDPEDERLICKYSTEKFNSEFIFVTHFPSSKRPFYTMDDPEDPEYTLGFDLLFRGLEITTGGQRIHKYDDYVEKMKNRGMNIDNFKFYLEAFKFGMPPHGGLAIGLERITAKLLNLPNIREASLFPRDITRLIP